MAKQTAIETLSEIEPVREYLNRIGAEPRSLRRAVVAERVGHYWKDIATIKFGEKGEVTVRGGTEYEPTEAETKAIAEAWPADRMPRSKQAQNKADTPPAKDIKEEDLFRFLDPTGRRLLMIQQRIETKEGKNYLPWSWWSDGRWRCCEPDGALPLYGLEQLKDHETVFIHEGAKAARAVRDMLAGEHYHPWRAELGHAAHLGWIGGALNPLRTDWTPLRKAGIRRIYIVADNDHQGRTATPRIAKAIDWDCIVMVIEFSDLFPIKFDLGDPFPDPMFRTIAGHTYYKGPAFAECRHPATWATRKIETGDKGRPKFDLREGFARMWSYVETADSFVCREMPEIVRSEAILNKMMARFSDVDNTAKLLAKHQDRRSVRMAYRPDVKSLSIQDGESSAINLHVPTRIKSEEGDPAPWLEFLDYLVPNDAERNEVMKWCATLIAHPEVRIGYGLLMVSERQGIGKTTLGNHVLAPLVGWHNTSFPGEADIMSPFNEWVALKRLAVVNEIYTGSSWKAYHALKSVITDRHITVNRKYERQYTTENWCHIYASSNSLRALKMEDSDRRWHYPELIETPWPAERFTAFREWLDRGGLQIIKNWAEHYDQPLRASDTAPITERKRQLIEDSLSPAQAEAIRLGNLIAEMDQPIFITSRDLKQWIKGQVREHFYDTAIELRRAIKTVPGIHEQPRRIKRDGALQYVFGNSAGSRLVTNTEQNRKAEVIRNNVRNINSLFDLEL